MEVLFRLAKISLCQAVHKPGGQNIVCCCGHCGVCVLIPATFLKLTYDCAILLLLFVPMDTSQKMDIIFGILLQCPAQKLEYIQN